jgi:CheY-like chemotaxis protein
LTVSASDEARLRREHGGAHVLLVEDHPSSRDVVWEMLGDMGLRVDVAANGEEAIEKARARVYDLVLMDVQMPLMDGPQATRAIRRLTGWHDTPILALSANVFPEARRACLEAGMNDFIPKPVDYLVFGSTLLKWLSSRDAVRTATDCNRGLAPAPAHRFEAAARDSGLNDARLLASLERLKAVAGLSLERGISGMNGNASKYVGLLSRFVTANVAAVAQLRRMLAEGNRALARDEAHGIKGAAAMLAAEGIAACAATLEQELRSVDHGERDVFGLVDALERAFADVSAALSDSCRTEP